MGEELQRWTDKKFDLLIDLVYLIGQSLGYKKIDKATLRDNSYIPQGMVDVETEMASIRKGWSEILEGTRPIPMTVVAPVQIAEPPRREQTQAPPLEISNSEN
jgi:hypothetical protein